MESSSSDAEAATFQSAMYVEETIKSEKLTLDPKADRLRRTMLKYGSDKRETATVCIGTTDVTICAGTPAGNATAIANFDSIVATASAGTTAETASDDAIADIASTDAIADIASTDITDNDCITATLGTRKSYSGSIQNGLKYFAKLTACAREREAFKEKYASIGISHLLNEGMESMTLNEPSESEIIKKNPNLMALLQKGKKTVKSSKEAETESRSQEQSSMALIDEKLSNSTETDLTGEEFQKKQKVSQNRALKTSPNVPRAKKSEGSSHSECSETPEVKRKFSDD